MSTIYTQVTFLADTFEIEIQHTIQVQQIPNKSYGPKS